MTDPTQSTAEPEAGDAPTRAPGRVEMFAATAVAHLSAQPKLRLAAAALAVLAGLWTFSMQFVGRTPERAPTAIEAPAAPTPAPARSGGRALAALPDMPEPPVAMPRLAAAPIRPVAEVQELRASAVDCTVTLQTTRLAAATLAVDVDAPCDAGARMDVIQGDLEFALRLDADGRAALEIPVLSAAAAVAVAVEGRDPVTALEQMADLGAYRRIALQWQGPAAFELHAFEGGAGYGEDGHVAPGTPRDMTRALSGKGGYLVSLGDPSLPGAGRALIYTVPAGNPAAIAVEIPVTQANCGQAVTGTTIQATPGIPTEVQPVSLTVPGCDAVGDILMLGDLPAPQALAAN